MSSSTLPTGRTAWQRSAMAVTFKNAAELLARANTDLGSSEWETMTIEMIRKFADATGDHQWIHVDEERAARESPFKKAIAHGYLSLSLTAGRFFQVVDLSGFELAVNYGTNKVRFPSPLPVGAKFRTSFKLGEVKDVGGGWTEGLFHLTVEIDGQTKPACVAETVFRVKAAS